MDGSGWEGVYKALRRAGYSVASVQNPTISLADDAQRAMSRRAGATVVEIKASHAVFASQPQAVAALIEQAARGARLALARPR